jgi:hypothetical protein
VNSTGVVRSRLDSSTGWNTADIDHRIAAWYHGVNVRLSSGNFDRNLPVDLLSTVIRRMTSPTPPAPGECKNLCGLMAARLADREAIVFRHVEGAASRVVDSISGSELFKTAGWIAQGLGSQCEAGGRVILCFPAGIDFVRIFY